MVDSMSATDATRIAVAVVEHAGRFLVGQRPEGVPLAGLWEFPGGKVQPDETPQQAAMRECLEETGLVVEVTGQYEPVEYQYEHGRLHLDFFACRPRDPSADPRPPFGWFERQDLAHMQFPAANARLIAELVARRGV
jgi:mutator protein MutT